MQEACPYEAQIVTGSPTPGDEGKCRKRRRYTKKRTGEGRAPGHDTAPPSPRGNPHHSTRPNLEGGSSSRSDHRSGDDVPNRRALAVIVTLKSVRFENCRGGAVLSVEHHRARGRSRIEPLHRDRGSGSCRHSGRSVRSSHRPLSARSARKSGIGRRWGSLPSRGHRPTFIPYAHVPRHHEPEIRRFR